MQSSLHFAFVFVYFLTTPDKHTNLVSVRAIFVGVPYQSTTQAQNFSHRRPVPDHLRHISDPPTTPQQTVSFLICHFCYFLLFYLLRHFHNITSINQVN